MSELARKLIAENVARHERGEDASFLDLGNCGLRELPEELGQCVWLEVLVLSHSWYEWKAETGESKWQHSQNQGEANRLHHLNGVERLKRLNTLIAGGEYSDKWPLQDLSPLSGLQNLQSLDCNTTQVQDLIPLSGLQNLQSLDCNTTQVQDLSPLSGLQNLQSLNCSSTPIQDLSPLFGLQNLQSLYCSNTQVQDLSPLSGLQNLQSLDCSDTQVQDLSPLSGLQNLQSLKCDWTQVQDLSPLSGLQNLQSLDCSFNNKLIGISLSDLKNLRKLKCSSCRNLTSIAFFEIENLEELDCNVTQVQDLSPLSELQNLQSLYCLGTQVQDLSPLSGLQNLQSLYCWGTQVQDLSPLSGLQNLQELDCSSTQVQDLSQLSGLQNLQELSCSRTQVQDLSPLSGLQNLQKLNCSRTQVQDLSPLSGLQNLQELDCSSTQVQDLSQLSGLQNLQELSCSSTQVQDLSPLSGLQNLQKLNCSRTQVQDLSPLSGLQNLQELDCGSTQVQDLSPLKGIIHQLETLDLRQSPIPYIPKEIYEQKNCAADLRAYWQSLAEGQITLNQQLKVMFLGNGCVGKTTLLHWFLDGAFREIPLEEGRTHGIIIQPYSFPGSELMAHFWDFGGQEVYHATHRLFLGRRTLYLLVWATETPEKQEDLRHPPPYWLDMIADVADPRERSRVLIIQNRFEGQPERSLFSDEQRAAYEAQGLELASFSVDAKRGKGIKPLLAAIQEAAEELVDTYQEQLPQNWVDIRTAVAQRRAAGEKTLPMDAFGQLCEDAGEKAAAQTILGYLHRAGEVFHYAGRFNDQIILDQQWALKAVYAVLKRDRIERYAGKFRVSDLIGFWRADNAELSAEDAETFLQFMLDNQTAFYAKDTDRGDDPELIVPQLLPEEAPSILHALEHIPDRLQHRVAYRFLHRDIISRFIVRTAYLSEQQEYWRQGIHIRKGQAKAAVFVEKDADGKPLLSLACYGQDKEGVLESIRETLHEIRSLDKAQEYRFADGAWQPYVTAPLGAKEGKRGLSAPMPVPEAVDLAAFFRPLKLFISYSKHDAVHKATLLNHLSGLRGKVATWHDRDIRPGEEWDASIQTALREADVVLYLVTHHSMATAYIQNVELPLIEQRCQAGACILVPVIVDFCVWEDLDFAKYHALPAQGTPITDRKRWQNENEAWTVVVRGIKQICNKRQ